LKGYSRLFLACGVVVLSPVASAGIIYSNIGSTFPNDSSRVYFSNNTFEAAPFTTAGGGILSSLEFAAYSYTPATTVTAALYTDSSGQPGTLIESWSAAIPVPGFSGTSMLPIPPMVLTSAVDPSLLPGTAYWFVLTQPNGLYSDVFGGDQSVNGGVWVGNSITALSQIFPDLEAVGIQLNSSSPNPEPATAMMLGLAFGALWIRKTNRR
jgi:hypothetical protein